MPTLTFFGCICHYTVFKRNNSFDVIKVEKNHIQEHGIKNCDHFQEISPFLTAITKGKQEPLEKSTDIAQHILSSI